MLSIVNGLIDLGVVAWLATAMQNALQGLTGMPAAIVIVLFYLFSMCVSAPTAIIAQLILAPLQVWVLHV